MLKLLVLEFRKLPVKMLFLVKGSWPTANIFWAPTLPGTLIDAFMYVMSFTTLKVFCIIPILQWDKMRLGEWTPCSETVCYPQGLEFGSKSSNSMPGPFSLQCVLSHMCQQSSEVLRFELEIWKMKPYVTMVYLVTYISQNSLDINKRNPNCTGLCKNN